MIWMMLPFAMIGVGVVVFVSCLLIGEVIRALRQSKRIAAIAIRHASGERRRITCREWLFSFRRELFSSYTSLRVGFIDVPRNPSCPFRARLPF